MSTKGKRLIKVSEGVGNIIEGVCVTANVLPGTVVENVAAGLQVNANAATVFGQELIIADKNSLLQKNVDEAWTQNENMVAFKAESGDIFNVLVADGNDITARGTPLSLNGAGKLKIAVTPATVGATSEQVLAYSDEIIDVSGADALVRVRIA